MSEKRSAVWPLLMLFAIMTILVAVYLWNPATEGEEFFPKCPTFAATGLYCPGCGTLRAMHQLLHGNLTAAMRYNLMTIFMLPVIAYGLLVSIVSQTTDRRLPCPMLSAKLTWMLLAILILFAILRNLPYYPLTLLAPPSL